jgi:integrase
MLTDTKLRNAKPKDKDYSITDGRGLSILITTKGGKWWRFRYRYLGKYKLMSLGTYPEISLLEARERRESARKLLAQNPPVNPIEIKKSERLSLLDNQDNSFSALAHEWAAAYFVNKSKSHKERTLRRLEVYMFPWIGNKPVSDITSPQVLEAIKRPQNQNKLETAHRALQATGQVFRYAVQTGKAIRDVTADLKGALPPAKKEHMAAFTEPKDVAELLRAIDGFVGTLTVECALRLAPLVFVRPGELRRAKWADIDLDDAEWSYLVTKTNTNHIVPLSTQAIKILKLIQPLSGNGEFVFQNGNSPRKAMSDAAINSSLRRMGYDTKTQITGHGFRAMARTILHERLNIDPAIIEHQLAHKVADTLRAAYNRTKFIEQRKIMMQAWADYLDELKASG